MRQLIWFKLLQLLLVIVRLIKLAEASLRISGGRCLIMIKRLIDLMERVRLLGDVGHGLQGRRPCIDRGQVDHLGAAVVVLRCGV